MGEWLNPSKWLITVLGGMLAAVAAAYFLHLFPPTQTLDQPDARFISSSDVTLEDGSPGLAARQEASGGDRQKRLDTLIQTSGFSDRAVSEPHPGPMETEPEARSGTVRGRQEELRSESVSPVQSGVKLLSPDTPLVFSRIDTVVSVSFRETLGSRYVEFVVDTPGQTSFRFPARSAGAAREFEAGGQRYEIRIIAIDWQAMTAHVTLRPTASS